MTVTVETVFSLPANKSGPCSHNIAEKIAENDDAHA